MNDYWHFDDWVYAIKINCGHMKPSTLSIRLLLFLVVLMASVFLSVAQAQQPPQPKQADDVPVMDGEAGPCSVEFTVTDAEGKPILNALINVHIAYGFGGVRKLDTGVYTNAEGKGKFIGLPAKVHKPPLEFRATKDDLTGIASYNPASECQAKHSIVMEKKK